MAYASSTPTPDRQALRGKIAMVTGATRGIGLATATLFARHGSLCIVVARDREAGKRVVAQLRSQGLSADLGIADVSSRAEVGALATELLRKYATIDILVNNAGVLIDEDRRAGPSSMDPATLERTLAVNLFGPVLMSAAFLPAIPRGGRIINVSSTMGQLSRGLDAFAPAYRISKAALNAYTQTLAAELKERGIMVDALHPGWVKTQMGGPNATVEPDEAAKTALFLATRPAGGTTGLFWRRDKPIDW